MPCQAQARRTDHLRKCRELQGGTTNAGFLPRTAHSRAAADAADVVHDAGEMVETPNGVLEMPDFGLTEAEKEYHGPPDDRRALMAHRKWLQV